MTETTLGSRRRILPECVTVNHRRQIFSATSGNPACWNDQTLVLFDDFVVSVYEGWQMQDFTFNLYVRNLSGNVMMAKYRGP